MENISKLRWRARRGMREIDQLLDRYIDEHYEQASTEEKSLLFNLLEYQDPELYSLLLHRMPPNTPEMAKLILKINPVE